MARDTWRLAPAYDLTPFPMASTERRDLAMICGARGRFANRSNLLSECRRFLFEPGEAADLIEGMAGIVSGNWYKVARQTGLSEHDCEAISPAFNYPTP
ncbi:MAG: HipA domain-containing protein [Clostridiales bacterium]|nr:HipA domain-containing protein [Clostridiales bacterium]